ncbi:MAG: Asp-tRNA(Asn)/Glu-tRNA(Gln) amidotransferase subunit GatC [Wolbachia endosymbiont of Tyrophagus putrescentiae]|nr:Asp-tRNA(Asn)/Glu-tRNA(Gln) amidotransferase subunit GatC [Wolbachia endosymbiont of Tyrophagus putrescentiae]
MPTKSTEDIITSLIEFANKRKITITKEEMLKIAHLVRIKLSDDEAEFYSRELTMLDWIHDTLAKVNIGSTPPIRYGSIDKKVHVRDDTVCSGNIKEDILSNTNSEDGYFVVPKAISD